MYVISSILLHLAMRSFPLSRSFKMNLKRQSYFINKFARKKYQKEYLRSTTKRSSYSSFNYQLLTTSSTGSAEKLIFIFRHYLWRKRCKLNVYHYCSLLVVCFQSLTLISLFDFIFIKTMHRKYVVIILSVHLPK